MTEHQPAPRRSLSRRSLLLRGGGLGVTALTMPWLLEACGKDSSSQEASAASIRAGGTLRAALTGEPDSLDPAVSSVYTGAQVYDNIFSKLLRFDADGKFVGDLAPKGTADNDQTG